MSINLHRCNRSNGNQFLLLVCHTSHMAKRRPALPNVPKLWTCAFTYSDIHSQILITSGTQQPIPFRKLHHVLLKDTGWYVHGKWGTTCSPLLQCTMVSTPRGPLDVPSRHTAARYCQLFLTQVYFKGPWLLGNTVELLYYYGSPHTVPPRKGCSLHG